jgi:hypothetical protein
MTDQRAAAFPGVATGAAARALAARLEAHGYQVSFPPGCDLAVFKVTGLPGRPDVEVSAENDGLAACYYTGCTPVQAAKVIARLPVPGRPRSRLPGRRRPRPGAASKSSGTTCSRKSSPATPVR